MIVFLCSLPVVACLAVPIWAMDKAGRGGRGDGGATRRWAGGSLAAAVGLMGLTILAIDLHPVCRMVAATLWCGLLANGIMLAESTFRPAARPRHRRFPVLPADGKESGSANCPGPNRPI